MRYSKATNYALHTMVYLALIPRGRTIGVRPLAEIQKVSPSYLSKVLTKLVKAGFVMSASGVNGGYKLIKDVEDISFLDIIHAVEGTASLFDCDANNEFHERRDCYIQQVMKKAEIKMEEYLKEHTVADVLLKVDESVVSFLDRESN